MLTGCLITGNAATGPGGGIYNSGTLTLTDSTVSSNTGNVGSGIYNSFSGSATDRLHCLGQLHSKYGRRRRRCRNFGQLMMDDTTVTGNTAVFGGGIYNLFGAANLTDCTISGNFAYIGGGGLLDLYATATLTDCTVSSNTILQAAVQLRRRRYLQRP